MPPTLSIVIPTFNEAEQITATIANAREACPAAEIIVVDGGSPDETVGLAEGLGVLVSVARCGRASQMNVGAALTSGETLLFLHADTRLPLTAAAQIAQALAEPAIVGGGFALSFPARGWLYPVMATSTSWRSDLRRIFSGDQAIFVRRQIFAQLGGFPNIPLMEDLVLSAALQQRGPVAVLRPGVLVSARRHQRYGALRVLVQGWGLQILHRLGMPPFGLHRLYYGRPPAE